MNNTNTPRYEKPAFRIVSNSRGRALTDAEKLSIDHLAALDSRTGYADAFAPATQTVNHADGQAQVYIYSGWVTVYTKTGKFHVDRDGTFEKADE